MTYRTETGADSAARVKSTCDALEALIDRIGLPNVVECLASVCGEKAEHVRVNWQDARAAKSWGAAETHLNRAAERVRTLGL